MNKIPLMPKATAIWLINNTKLSFKQIADFCHMHELEIQTLADGEGFNLIETNPIVNGQLSREDIERCEKNESAKLNLKTHYTEKYQSKKVYKKYVPIVNRQDKVDAVLWMVKHLSQPLDQEIIKLLGATKSVVDSIRNKTHWNYNNLIPRDPVLLGLCSQENLNKILETGEKRKTDKK